MGAPRALTDARRPPREMRWARRESTDGRAPPAPAAARDGPTRPQSDIVASELIPKIGHWTVMTRLYAVCLFANIVTFVVTTLVTFLVLLSREAQAAADQWAPPLLGRLVDRVFWHVPEALRSAHLTVTRSC